MMHDAKHVAVAPRVAAHRHHHGHDHGTEEEEVPVFVPSEQRQKKELPQNQRERPRSEGKAPNRPRGSPTKLFRSDKGHHRKGRLRNRTKSAPVVRSKGVSETRGRSSARRRKPALKAAAFDRRLKAAASERRLKAVASERRLKTAASERRLKAAASERRFSGLRRRSRKSKKEPVHLTAADLWSLNRSHLRCHCHDGRGCCNHCHCHHHYHNYHHHHGRPSKCLKFYTTMISGEKEITPKRV